MMTPQQRLQSILKEMASIRRLQRGTLSKQYYKNGQKMKRGPYYILQRTEGGRHFAKRLPREEVERVKQDIKEYARFQRLVDEFASLLEKESLPKYYKHRRSSQKTRISSSHQKERQRQDVIQNKNIETTKKSSTSPNLKGGKRDEIENSELALLRTHRSKALRLLNQREARECEPGYCESDEEE